MTMEVQFVGIHGCITTAAAVRFRNAQQGLASRLDLIYKLAADKVKYDPRESIVVDLQHVVAALDELDAARAALLAEEAASAPSAASDLLPPAAP